MWATQAINNCHLGMVNIASMVIEDGLGLRVYRISVVSQSLGDLIQLGLVNKSHVVVRRW
jgi:ABC-type proline/glycine betaine transport system permease subunit